MALEVEGTLYRIDAAQTLSENFTKREFVIKIPNGNYEPKYAPFQLVNDKCDIIEPYQVGQTVVVSFNLGGKPFIKEGKELFFPNCTAWKIQPKGSATSQSTASAKPEDEEDLPF